MANEITIPRLGWNMEEGTFVGWLKSDGQSVAAGEPLFTLEGDKSTEDVESLESGILRIPPDSPPAGAKVLVGALVGDLVAPGEPAPFEEGNGLNATVVSAAVSREGEAPTEPKIARAIEVGEARTEPETALAFREGEAPTEPHRAPARTEHQTPARTEPRPPEMRPRSSPRARRVARELGVDTNGLDGSGHGGRIRESDIRAAAQARATVAPASHSDRRSVSSSVKYGDMVLTPIRRTIADRMLQSAQTTAAVTLSTTIDATNLVNLRKQFKAVGGSGELTSISFTDIIVKLTAQALQDHPLLNARWSADKIVVMSTVNIGIAVDTNAGLFVPVIGDVPGLTLRQVAARSRELIDRARAGTLRAAEMQGGTFTVTNLGPMGIEMFTPIINLPECAILGVGRIQKQVVVDGTQFVARDRMMLSLTFDHRIVDGGPAARFLQSLGQMIENPSPWLLP